MAQNNVDYSNNPTGPQLLDNYLSKEQENHLTSNSGIQRPTYAQAGTTWLDNSTTPWVFNMYDGTTDVPLLSINPTTHKNITTNIDNVSITHNSSDELQALGVVNQNATSTALKSWSGTKAQYNAIITKDSNTLYHITDDTSDIYDTVANVINRIYPVGSIYITVSSSNPATLLGLGTWILVSSGRVLQGADANHAAGTTIEAGLPDITGSFSIINHNPNNHTYSGAFLKATNGEYPITGLSNGPAWTEGWGNITERFDASNSNSIYGNSNTVQPPAFVVNIWQRTA